jgi:4-diphosphocytidyl-2-C-methyl-D-erythritol kinase
LRLLNELHGIGLGAAELAEVGARVGSDVPFFVYGGTALVEGRGERVTALPDAPTAWFTIVVPKVDVPDKTGEMYSRLTADDWTDGSATNRTVAAISSLERVRPADSVNVFDRHAEHLVDGLDQLSFGMFAQGLCDVHAVGAGPSIRAYCWDEESARSLVEYVEALTRQPRGSAALSASEIFVVSTMAAAEAVASFD